MADYAKMAETALRLIRANGRSLRIVRYSSENDPLESTVIRTIEAEGNIDALILPASKGTIEAFDNRLGPDGLIDDKLRFVLAAAQGAPFEPKFGDIIEFDGLSWQVLGCTPLKPAHVAIIYRIGVKLL